MEGDLGVKSRRPIFRPSHMIGCKRKQTLFMRAAGKRVSSRFSLVHLEKGEGKLEEVWDMGSFQND